MKEDDPNYSAECAEGLPIGKPDCPNFEPWKSNEGRKTMNEKKKRFIKQLAEFLVEDQERKSMDLVIASP